ncbi:hypothetical protein [Caniella muris]|uniref:hypothetical protein n=1 Tax=Caniella muris TaxID=2941502 RepID=UPI00203E61D0|nr:hypothetical protein [Caniella muris]
MNEVLAREVGLIGCDAQVRGETVRVRIPRNAVEAARASVPGIEADDRTIVCAALRIMADEPAGRLDSPRVADVIAAFGAVEAPGRAHGPSDPSLPASLDEALGRVVSAVARLEERVGELSRASADLAQEVQEDLTEMAVEVTQARTASEAACVASGIAFAGEGFDQGLTAAFSRWTKESHASVGTFDTALADFVKRIAPGPAVASEFARQADAAMGE